MAHKRNTTHNGFTVQTLKHYETKRLKEHCEKNTTGTNERDTKHVDDTDEMAANECEHFSAWKLKKHLELLQKVSINSILKGFILTMLQALKDHQFLHDNHNNYTWKTWKALE